MKTIPVRQSNKLAIVDDEDYDRLMQFNWRAVSKERTVLRNYWVGLRTRSVSMASEVMKNPSQMYDHIDRNAFNNQKNNLRPATQQQNCFNRPKGAGCSSQYKGVSWKKNLKKWAAQIKYEQRAIYLGCYQTEVEAAKVYDAKAKELFGEFAVLNFPQTDVNLGEEEEE